MIDPADNDASTPGSDQDDATESGTE
jgi:hypothetical protein